MRSMAVGEFKAKCLAVIEEVSVTGQPILLTKRGKPVARVTSLDEGNKSSRSILGRLKHMGSIRGDIVSSEFSDDEWERMAGAEPSEPRKNRRK
jgi:prevent-host-death family protein